MTEILTERLKHAVDTAPKGFCWDYIRPDAGRPETAEQVMCKLTGITLQQKRKIGSRMMLAPTAAYGEIKINFDDGTSHVTAIALDAAHGLSKEDLEHIYCADLAQWLSENARIVDAWTERTPIGYEIVEAD